jgi:WD40 repeat protein
MWLRSRIRKRDRACGVSQRANRAPSKWGGFTPEVKTMHRPHIPLALIVVILFCSASSLAADPIAALPQEGKGSRRQVTGDRYGDVLPRGSIARFGTVRLRTPGMINAVAFCDGGRKLALAMNALTEGETLAVLDAASGKELYRGARFPDWAHVVASSPDGHIIAVGGNGGHVALHDSRTFKELSSIQAHTSETAAACFSPDGRTLATAGCDDNTVALWEARTGRNLTRFSGHSEYVNAVAFHPGGRKVVSAACDHTLRLWDVTAEKLDCLLKCEGYDAYSVAFAQGGALLACGTMQDGSVRLWDLVQVREVCRLRTGSGPWTRVAVSPDGSTLATVNCDGSVRLWDVAKKKETISLNSHAAFAADVAFSPDGKILAWVGGGTVHIWDIGTRNNPFAPFVGHEDRVEALAFSPDGTTLTSASADEATRVWELLAGRQTRCLRTPRSNSGLGRVVLSPDGRILAGTHRNHPFFLFDLQSDQGPHFFPGESDTLALLAISPDGQTVCQNTSDHGTKLWDVDTGKVCRSLALGDTNPNVITFSPDGTALAVADRTGKRAGDFGRITVFDLSPAGDKERLHLERSECWLRSLAFSADGRSLAAGIDKENVVCLWELATRQLRLEFPCPQGAITSLAFHPGGRLLATGGADTTILLWDLALLAGCPSPLEESDDGEIRTALWEDLASSDAKAAFRAVLRLARRHAKTVPFLSEHCFPQGFAERERLKELVVQLDSDSFDTRERATKALERLGPSAATLLQAAEKGPLSPEARRRLHRVLEHLKGLAATDAGVRATRAVEVLEMIATPEARRLLEKLADKAPNPRYAQEAKNSLARLSKRR